MRLKTRGWGLPAAVLFVLIIPVLAHSHEERPVSMEAILEELASLRSIVEAQQKQIEELRAAVQPADAPRLDCGGENEFLRPADARAGSGAG